MPIVHFTSLLFTALAPVPALAHLMELPGKIHLSRRDYFLVQQIYRGWALTGILVVVAPISTVVLSLLMRGQRSRSSRRWSPPARSRLPRWCSGAGSFP